MRDLGLAGFWVAILMLGLKRPFLFIVAYIYIDIVSPQRLSYGFFASVPVSLVTFGLAILGWVITDKKDDVRVAPRQLLMVALLIYAGLTTFYLTDEYRVEAFEKWDWVWKSMVFAIFLPLTLRTKLRLETVLLFMSLSLAAIVIGAGIKTVFGGSGYGSFAMMVDDNSGLYEDSTLSTMAVAMIPIILYFSKFGTIFKPDWRVKLFCFALVFACLLTPIGTQARTGLVCAVFLAVLMLRDNKYKARYIGGAAILGIVALPLIPAAFTERMGTISTYQADESASSRLSVWAWTLERSTDHPLGGGFEIYRGNSLSVQTSVVQGSAGNQTVTRRTVIDRGRAFHSAYFEMLGEQGWVGLGLWLIIHGVGLVRMEWIRRHYRRSDTADEDAWVSPLATALQHAHLVYLLGALFVGIAFQPVMLILLGVQIGFDTYLSRIRKARGWTPIADQLKEPGVPKLVPLNERGV